MYYNKVGFILGMHDWFNIWKWINVIHHTNSLKKTNYRLRKCIWHNSTSFADKKSYWTRDRGMNEINKCHVCRIYNLISQWWTIICFLSQIRNKAVCPFSPLQCCMEVLASVIRQAKDTEGIQLGKEDVNLSLFADDMTIYQENPMGST